MFIGRRFVVILVFILVSIVSVYAFDRYMVLNVLQTGSKSVAMRYKLMPNNDVVYLLNSIVNLDWENLFLAIVPTSKNVDFNKPVDVNIFKVILDANKTPVPGKKIEMEYISHIIYHSTTSHTKPADIYNGSVCFKPASRTLEKCTRPVAASINTSFLAYASDTDRKKMYCTVVAMPGSVVVCDSVHKYFPVNDTVHRNHMLSNPMHNIDSRFSEFKYAYYRRWRDDVYAECVGADKPEIRECDKSSDPNFVSVYTGAGKCAQMSRNERACQISTYTTGSNYVKISDVEFFQCRDKKTVKCEDGHVYPDGAWNLSRCVKIGSAAQ